MKKAYFINIAGTAMAGLAVAFKKMGWEVTGSDQKNVYPPATKYLDDHKICYFKGYSEDNLSFTPDLVVVGRSALIIDPDNPEYGKAKSLGIRILSYPEVVRDYLIKKNSIVVAGTFQKSTTTALISWILINAGLNPSFMIGGFPLNFSEGTRITNSEYSVVEGDETPALQQTDPPKFMFYQPKYLLLTATEYDHPEIYKTKDDYLMAYVNLVKLLPSEGILFYDPKNVDEKVVDAYPGKKIAYLTEYGTSLEESFRESALRAITLCRELGIADKIINDSISSFKGLKARQEFLGEFGGRFFYQDLAQQPAKIKGILKVLRKKYSRNKIMVIFNPSATSLKYREILNDYYDAFLAADQVIVAKVEYLKDISGEKRVMGSDLVNVFGGNKKVIYIPVNENIVEWINKNSEAEDVIVFMSSGGLEFTKLIEKTKNELGKLGRLGDTKTNKYETLIKLIGSERVKKNVSLADQTTFKIGGPADLFYEAETEEELVRVIREIRKIGVPYFILGGGSNVLVGDRGFRGIVIKIKYQKSHVNSKEFTVQANIKNEFKNQKYYVYVESGMLLLTLLEKCVENSLTGLEFMAGIPGTVGGAIRGNAGAWQKSIGEKVLRVKVLKEDGRVIWVEQKDCQFAYRESLFKKNNEIILAVEFGMKKDDRGKIEERIKEYLSKRICQPREPSAGCIFVNPKPQSVGDLIDQCGLKGTQIGGAKISEQHANFIVNVGKAKAAEVVGLIDLAKKKVHAKFGIDLQEEIIRMGEF